MASQREELTALRRELAMGQSFWIERWVGSGVEGEGPELRRGSSIWTVGKIVQLHNAAMNALLFGSNIGAAPQGGS